MGICVAAALARDGFPKIGERQKPLMIAYWPLLPCSTV